MNSYDCYYVRMNLDVYEPKDIFVNGENEYVITVVKENEVWYIGTFHRYEPIALTYDLAKPVGGILPTRTLEEDKANTYYYSSYSSQLSTIKVRDDTRQTYIVSFKEFIVNVTCNEIGAMRFSTDAVVANIIAIKMCGWWATAANRNNTYHIKGGSNPKFALVAYVHGSYGGCTSTQVSRVRELVTKYTDTYMISSSASGSKIFFPNY